MLYIFITPLFSKKGVQALGAAFQLFCPWGPLWHSSDTESESGRGGGGGRGELIESGFSPDLDMQQWRKPF